MLKLLLLLQLLSQGVHGHDQGGHYYFQQKDDYREKYITLLEQEIERLKGGNS